VDTTSQKDSNMYLVIAIIRHHLLESVRDALQDVGVIGVTVSDCRGSGHQLNVTHSFRGSQYGNSLEPRVRLEIALNEAHLNDAVDAIQKSACTGEIGDGKILVLPIQDAVRIRTNERGKVALEA